VQGQRAWPLAKGLSADLAIGRAKDPCIVDEGGIVADTAEGNSSGQVGHMVASETYKENSCKVS
jgi:hypothetical protein